MKKLKGDQLELFPTADYVSFKPVVWSWLKDQPSTNTLLNVRSIKKSQ